ILVGWLLGVSCSPFSRLACSAANRSRSTFSVPTRLAPAPGDRAPCALARLDQPAGARDRFAPAQAARARTARVGLAHAPGARALPFRARLFPFQCALARRDLSPPAARAHR